MLNKYSLGRVTMGDEGQFFLLGGGSLITSKLPRDQQTQYLIPSTPPRDQQTQYLIPSTPPRDQQTQYPNHQLFLQGLFGLSLDPQPIPNLSCCLSYIHPHLSVFPPVPYRESATCVDYVINMTRYRPIF